jgi:hypothetical protein
MTPSNFNWFLHVMLFYHTRLIIEKQAAKAKGLEEVKEEGEDGDDRTDSID